MTMVTPIIIVVIFEIIDIFCPDEILDDQVWNEVVRQVIVLDDV